MGRIARAKGPGKPVPVDRIGPGAQRRAKSARERVAIKQRRKEMLRSAISAKRGMES